MKNLVLKLTTETSQVHSRLTLPGLAVTAIVVCSDGELEGDVLVGV